MKSNRGYDKIDEKKAETGRKKMLKKVLRFLTQRVVITALFILIQAVLLFGIIWKLNNYFVYFYAASVLLSVVMTLKIINDKSNPAYKIAWLIPILLLPVFGGLIYILFGSDRTGRYMRISPAMPTARHIKIHRQNIFQWEKSNLNEWWKN